MPMQLKPQALKHKLTSQPKDFLLGFRLAKKAN